MREIRVTISDGPCTSSMTKLVADIPFCIENIFREANNAKRHRPCNIQDIKLDFKDGEVLGRPENEED